MEEITIRGKYTFQHWRSGQLLNSGEFDNLITLEGKSFLMDQALSGQGKVFSRMGLLTAGTPTVNDTYASHPGFTEATVAQLGKRVKPVWLNSVAGLKETDETIFIAEEEFTVTGAFLVLKAGTEGNLATTRDTTSSGAALFSVATLGAPVLLTLQDTLVLTYQASI